MKHREVCHMVPFALSKLHQDGFELVDADQIRAFIAEHDEAGKLRAEMLALRSERITRTLAVIGIRTEQLADQLVGPRASQMYRSLHELAVADVIGCEVVDGTQNGTHRRKMFFLR